MQTKICARLLSTKKLRDTALVRHAVRPCRTEFYEMRTNVGAGRYFAAPSFQIPFNMSDA